MKSIATAPGTGRRAGGRVMAAEGRPLAGARVIVIGVSYKSGVRDLRESPALPIIDRADPGGRRGRLLRPADPGARAARRPGAAQCGGTPGTDYDLAVVHTLHPGLDYTWAHDAPVVLDATYQFSGAAHRAVV